jgi:asparagine synthase (glutamine-hydrolysing)
MCGITGIASLRGAPLPTPLPLQAMCERIVHRGPDEEGMDTREGVALGMRRLSIIDLSGGSQPIFNEDGTIRTVFNGEIYNFRELRKDLEGCGHTFSTRSDTEVIVHGYEEYGDRFPEKLNGMFAIALHDSAKKRLLLTRDHIGIKPLYYAITDRHLVWGSEIKSILASGLMGREPDLDAIGQFMSWEYVPGPQTLFKPIRKLGAGELLELNLETGTISHRTYWDVPIDEQPNGFSIADWEARVCGKLEECVQRQLISDVPLGAFLSGGVDSSLMTALMGEAKTYSIGFAENSYNELPYAKKVAAHLGVAHKYEVLRPDITALFERLIYFLDDPIGDFSIFPTFLVSQFARQEVTVALSGEGGDELFGGYETYVADALARHYQHIPASIRSGLIAPAVAALKPRPVKKGLINKTKRFIEGAEQPQVLGHARWRLFVGERERRRLFTPEALAQIVSPVAAHIAPLYERAVHRDPVNQRLYVDLKSYLCDNLLTKIDRMSMANSLEARVPYLDRELVELAFQVPGTFKVSGGKTKVLLKRAAARYVPRECVYRPKEGFSIPIKTWLNQSLLPVMEELLDSRRISQEGLFQANYVKELKDEHLAGRANHSHVLWSLMVFQAWRRRWLEQ